MRIAVSVTSKTSTEESYPILSYVSWGTQEIDASVSGNAVQRLYATVSKGIYIKSNFACP